MLTISSFQSHFDYSHQTAANIKSGPFDGHFVIANTPNGRKIGAMMTMTILPLARSRHMGSDWDPGQDRTTAKLTAGSMVGAEFLPSLYLIFSDTSNYQSAL